MSSEVTVHNELVSPGNLFEIVVVIELLGDVGSEVETRASERSGPSCLLVWVGPDQVAHWPVGWHFLYSVQCPNMVQFVDDWRQSSMQTEYRVVCQSK